VLYVLAAVAWIPTWVLCVFVPPLVSRQALAMHELIHIAPVSGVDPLTRLFPIFDSPLSLGYRELRDIHLGHHRYNSTERDPEWHQIRGPSIRALAAAFVAIERGTIEWIRKNGIDRSLLVGLLVRNAAIVAAIVAAPEVFVWYWVTLRITVGISQFQFHHLLHYKDGVYDTYPNDMPLPLRLVAGLLTSRRYLPIVTNHDAHHAWPTVRVERLPGLLEAYPKTRRAPPLAEAGATERDEDRPVSPPHDQPCP
jgi:fatty acid desaturase